MRILYPSDPLDKNKPDDYYEEEVIAALDAGFDCSLYAAEEFEFGEFKPRPALDGDDVLYRGWMLTPEQYDYLLKAVNSHDGRMITSVAQYKHCHYLPEWYHACETFTPKTVFAQQGDDYAALVDSLGWSAYFVKDYVKSLTTSRGSFAKNASEIDEIVELIAMYRGRVEGGVCIREFEELRDNSEERYFVYKGKAFARDGNVPDIVQHIASRIDSPFYSVDVVLSANGTPRLMELGDGQVSDRKDWDAATFMQILTT